MRIQCLQHVPFEEPGLIKEWAEERGHQIECVRVFGGRKADVKAVDMLVVLGGPMGACDEDRYPWLVYELEVIEKAIGLGLPVLGVCLGAQIIARVLGGTVSKNPEGEIGWFPVKLTDSGIAEDVFKGFPVNFPAFHWHGDTFDAPPGSVNAAYSGACANQAFVYNKKVVALQFHLEAIKEGIEQLMTNCADEMIPGAYIQTPETIRDGFYNISQCGGLLYRLLDNLVSSN